MRTIQYAFVDTENVSQHFDILLENLNKHAYVLLFYTDINKSHGMSLELLDKLVKKGLNIKPIYCNNGAHDMLDFCLCEEFGYILHKNESLKTPQEYIVYSNDEGYDGMIQLVRQKGFNARRLSWQKQAATKAKTAKKKAETTVPPEPQDLFKPGYFTQEECLGIYENMLSSNSCKKDIAKAIAKMILNAKRLPANKQLQDVHIKITQKYGQDKGKEKYDKLKSVIKKIIDEGPCPPPPI